MELQHIAVNALNEPAMLYVPMQSSRIWKSSQYLTKIAGRLNSLRMAVLALPQFFLELRRHHVISIEGTQYPKLASLVCIFARFGGKKVFLHNHSVQPILSLPKKIKTIFFKQHALGIVFSDTLISRNLYGADFNSVTYRTGLLKYKPEWIDFCRARKANSKQINLCIFTKRISYSVYRELLYTLLERLKQSCWVKSIIIKPHPMDGVEVYSALLAAFPSMQISLSYEPNFSLMPILQMGICFPGSSILDCDAFAVPAIELRPKSNVFGHNKNVPNDYADSGYPSTSDIDTAVAWIYQQERGHRTENPPSIRKQGENELNALLDLLVTPKSATKLQQSR